MLRLALVCGLFLGGLSLVLPPSGVAADEPAARPDASFDGKAVVVVCKSSGKFTSQLLQKVTVKRLGGREFLVGEFVMPEGQEAPAWKGAIQWIPIENVDSLTVFTDRSRALRVVEDAMKAAKAAATAKK